VTQSSPNLRSESLGATSANELNRPDSANGAGVSVLILTRNEEDNLPGCLESVAWCDDIHVLDSGSTDRTCEIARQFRASVVTKTYAESGKLFGGNESAHRNWSLHNTVFKHPWVLQLDADERVTPELARSVLQAIKSPGDVVAFRIRRRDFFMGTWLRHVQSSPFYLRLFRPERMRTERLVNPVYIADGPVATVQGYLDHFPFSKGLAHWVARHNDYSTLEAEQILENRRRGAGFSVRKAFLARDIHERRFHQKELFYRMPLRPFLKFLLLYVVKRGFLDGNAGLNYALLQSVYERMIVMKVDEAKAASNNAHAREQREGEVP